MASLLLSRCPPSEMMMGEKREVDGENLGEGKAILKHTCLELYHGCQEIHGCHHS